MTDIISIQEAEDKAQEIGFDSAWMTVIAPNGKETRLQWMDAYLGCVWSPDHKDFIQSRDLIDMGCRAKDVSLEQTPAA